jgi:hypothetical protein
MAQLDTINTPGEQAQVMLTFQITNPNDAFEVTGTVQEFDAGAGADNLSMECLARFGTTFRNGSRTANYDSTTKSGRYRFIIQPPSQTDWFTVSVKADSTTGAAPHTETNTVRVAAKQAREAAPSPEPKKE